MSDGYDGRAIANFVLDYCDELSRAVTHLSLQKILFFCHAWHLVSFQSPLIQQKFEAWEFGPVLPYIYHEFKKFDRSPIASRSTSLNRSDGSRQVVLYNFDHDVESHLKEVIRFYSRMRAIDLVELSHAKGGPWYVVWNHAGQVNPGMRIDNTKIREFYSSTPPPFTLQ